jgi:hypothetical protein
VGGLQIVLVYKYVVPKRIDVIENGCIRLTQAAALNDPFEVYPCFKARAMTTSAWWMKAAKITSIQLSISPLWSCQGQLKNPYCELPNSRSTSSEKTVGLYSSFVVADH